MKVFTFRWSARVFAILVSLLIAGGAMAQCTFTANQRTGCKGSYVLNLTNTTAGSSNTNWLITFSDGTTNTVPNNQSASKPMTVCGRVKVTMTTTVGGNTCTVVDSNFQVNCPPVIRGTFSTYNTCLGQPICYNDLTTSPGCDTLRYILDWQQSPIDTNVPSCKTYTRGGTYVPTLFVTNSCGCQADSTFPPINILARPVASFTGAPLSGCATPMTSTMTATGGTATTIYYWYVDGSTTATQVGHSPTFTHAYNQGVHGVKLIALDSLSGCADTLNRPAYLNVGSYAAACFTATQSTTCAPGSARYCPCTPGALSYTWNFPGGTPASSNSTSNTCVNVSYTNPGFYGAQLIVYYAGGCADTMTNYHMDSFGTPIPLDFTTDKTYSCTVPVTANLTYTGTPCASCTFSWNPPGNTTPTSHTGTSVTLTTYQNYTPVLRVTDTLGCTSTLIQNNLIVAQRLRATARVIQLGNGCVNDTFLVVNNTVGGPFTSETWSFPGGITIPRGQDSVYVKYTTKGCHRYMLALQAASGCIDTLRDSICVTGKPSVSLSIYPHDVCYEQECNNFRAVVTSGTDTPTRVIVWTEGLGTPSANVLLQDSAGIFVNCYTYHDLGSFLPCYLATSGTCHGDTVCLNGPTDSVHIWAPAAQFTKVLGCAGSNAVTLTSTTVGADSIRWNVDGQIFINQNVLNTSLIGPCGSRHVITLTAYNFTTGCEHSKSDTFNTSCTGIDFASTGPRIFCSPNAYRDTINLILGPGASNPINVVWSVGAANSGPNFTTPPAGYTGYPFRPVISAPSVYKVCGQFTYVGGCKDTVCKSSYISIMRPFSLFSVSDTAGCSPFAVRFTGNPQYSYGDVPRSVIWSFGDGSNVDSSGLVVSHTYSGFNSYIAGLTVIDSFGCSSFATKTIVSDSVVADFAMSDTITCQTNPSPLNPLTFSSTSTGYVSHYQWLLPAALGPTNPNPGDVPSFSCQFANEGVGNVCLVAIDRYNICRDTICKRVTVRNPVADYTFTNLSDTANACPIIIVNPFIDLSQNDICSYYWTFGDGSQFDTARNASHIYTRPGTYPITHIVTSCHGCKDTIVKYTIRARGPVVHMTSEKAGGCGCIPVKFFISSYDADSLEIQTDNGVPAFIPMSVPRGTIANPTLDTVTVTYCDINVYRPYVRSWQFPGQSCIQVYTLEDVTGDSIPILIDTPRVNFSYNPQTCGSEQVCFTDQTTYFSSLTSTAQRAWDFGDSTPVDSTATPCHTYALPGDYTVTLSIRNSLGCTGTRTYQVHVKASPQARIVMDDTIGCVPLLLHFRDSSIVDDSTTIVSGQWNIGYNSTVFNTYQDTSFNYTTGGNYTASLIVTDGYGCSDTAYQNIVVKPVATLTKGADQTICVGTSATLSATGSPPLHWEPNYNLDTTNPSAPVVAPLVDTFYVVRAGDVPRCYKYDTIKVNVSIITASDTATNLCLGQTTQLTATATATHTSVASYFWSFGDGTTGSGQSVSHSYFTPGIYHDTLIVVSSLGCKDTVYNVVNIGDKPHAVLSVSPASLCLGAPVTVTNNSTAGTSAPLAAFGIDMQSDGTPEFNTSPSAYTYTQPGTYTVTLIQADGNGCVDSAQQSVSVHRIPVSMAYADTNCIDRPNTLTGTWLTGDGSISHYRWSINGVAQPEDSATIRRTWSTPGTYRICFGVEDVYGCQSPDSCSNIIIISEPIDTVNPRDTTICLGYSVSYHVTGLFGSVKWVPAAYVDNPNSTDVTITPRQPMSYLLNVYYGHCTPKVDTVSIYVIDSVPVEATANPENIVLGLNSNVSSTVKGTIDSIVWDPDSTLSCRTCRNPIATPHQTTTYNATIYYSKNGVTCSNRTSVTVTVITSCDNSLIYIPNTFTPNTDGRNDVFRIRGQGITKVNYFRIYDRWGNIVHDVMNADSPDDAAWNGGKRNDKSRPENTGVFVYVFEVVCTTGQTISGKGNVTLIR